MESPSLISAPLKGKLSRVKCYLDDANRRLQEEASQYGIFTTESSANLTISGTTTTATAKNQIKRTINDIDTLKSVLTCPLFDQIVNVTDSLDKLSYELNLHPSITPQDVNIDDNGELMLSIEPTTLNNLINSKLDRYSSNNIDDAIFATTITTELEHQMPMLNGSRSPTNQNPNRLLQDTDTTNEHHETILMPNSLQDSRLIQTNSYNNYNKITQQNNDLYRGSEPEYQQHDSESSTHNFINHNQYESQRQKFSPTTADTKNHNISDPNYVPSATAIISTLNSYNPEKLVSNGKTSVNIRQKNNLPKAESLDESKRFHRTIDQPRKDMIKTNFHDQHVTKALTRQEDTMDDIARNGYSNEMYRTAQEMKQQPNSIAIEQKQHIPSNGSQNVTKHDFEQNAPNAKVLNNRGSCSPSTSAGSTVKLADECDSGASSYQSQTTKGAHSYTNYAYKPLGPMVDSVRDNNTIETGPDSLESESNSDSASDMRRIKVTLEKDSNGLGIIFAGYSDQAGVISGIFVKSMIPGGAADRTGKIRSLDQIVGVNGKELLGYTNQESFEELKRTGKVVTLELMRCITQSKYTRIQSKLESADYLPNSRANVQADSSTPRYSTSPIKSSIPVFNARDISYQSPTRTPTSPSREQTSESSCVQVSIGSKRVSESIYKNDPVPDDMESLPENNKIEYISSSSDHQQLTNDGSNKIYSNGLSHIPVAAQRGGTNKVIETKQGARNTIDIRSPVCQSAVTAGHVNESPDLDYPDAAVKRVHAKLEKEVSDEFGRLVKSDKPEWEKETRIIEIHKDPSKGLGFIVKDYINPKDPKQSIIMIKSITPGSIVDRDGRLESGDILIFVDDVSLEGCSLSDAVKAIKKANGLVRLGVLKLKRN